MIGMIKVLWSNTLIRYVLIGTVSYAIELTVLYGLYTGASIQKTIATAIAFWAGLILSFILQKFFAFRDYNKEVKALTTQSIAYGGLVLWNYLFTLVVVGLAPGKFLLLSRTAALLITTVWNYLFYKRVVFRS